MNTTQFEKTVQAMSDPELFEATERATNELNTLTRERTKRAAQRIQAMMESIKDLGLDKQHMTQMLERAAGVSDTKTLEKILSEMQTQGETKAKVYQDPQNPKNVWRSRGRRPLWLQKRVENGEDIEKFVVENDAEV